MRELKQPLLPNNTEASLSLSPQAVESGWQTQCAVLLRLQTERKNESNKEVKVRK